MNKKRVLIVSDYFLPHWTGIVTSLTYLISRYDSHYDFTVLTINHTGSLPARERLKSADIIRVPYQFSFSRAKYSLLLIPAFLNMLTSFDTVFINSPNSNILPLALLAKLFRKRVVIFHQGDLILTRGILNRIIESVFDFQSHCACFLANAVGTYTLDYARHSRILSRYMDKIHSFLLIPKETQAQTIEFAPVKTVKQQGCFTFGFAGRYVEEKGVDILLSAIEHVVKKNKKVHFFFAGDKTGYEKGDYFERYPHLKQYVTNLGLLTQPALNSYLASIDYLLLPSRSDCFPLVQVESLLCGTPIIASDAPGLRVPVMTTHFGFLFKNGDPSELSETILDAIAKRPLLLKHKTDVTLFLNQSTYDGKIRTFIEG